jgi:hypothetical protein
MAEETTDVPEETTTTRENNEIQAEIDAEHDVPPLSWNTKEIDLSVGDQIEGDDIWVKVEIFHDREMNITLERYHRDDRGLEKMEVENISLEAAAQLRDFLIYALPKNK